jgi:hypothetical protein
MRKKTDSMGLTTTEITEAVATLVPIPVTMGRMMMITSAKAVNSTTHHCQPGHSFRTAK